MSRHAEHLSWFHLFLNLFVYSPDQVHTLAHGDFVRTLYIVELYTAMPIEVCLSPSTTQRCMCTSLTLDQDLLRIPVLGAVGQEALGSRLSAARDVSGFFLALLSGRLCPHTLADQVTQRRSDRRRRSCSVRVRPQLLPNPIWARLLDRCECHDVWRSRVLILADRVSHRHGMVHLCHTVSRTSTLARSNSLPLYSMAR